LARFGIVSDARVQLYFLGLAQLSITGALPEFE
jgi:hypothetical protein